MREGGERVAHRLQRLVVNHIDYTEDGGGAEEVALAGRGARGDLHEGDGHVLAAVGAEVRLRGEEMAGATLLIIEGGIGCGVGGLGCT